MPDQSSSGHVAMRSENCRTQILLPSAPVSDPVFRSIRDGVLTFGQSIFAVGVILGGVDAAG